MGGLRAGRASGTARLVAYGQWPYDCAVTSWPGLFERDPERMPLLRLVAVAGTQLARYSQRVLAEHDATVTSIGVLSTLAESDGLSHRDIARQLWLTPATLTPVVDGLERAGHVQRERDSDDRRVLRLHLTEAGRDWLAETYDQVAHTLRASIPAAPPGHEHAIRNYLAAVLAAVNDCEGPPWPAS